MKTKNKRMLLPLLTTTAAIVGIAQAAPVSISTLPGVTGPAPFRVTGNVTLSSGTDYLLDEEIYVDGGTLTIQPGVLIAAAGEGALIVTRGSQIFAEGTAEQPIVFTSQLDYDHIKDPVNNPAATIGDNGDWGGVIILGSAPINFAVATNPFTGVAGNTNKGENQIEGVSSGTDTDGDGIGDLLEYGQDNVLDTNTSLLIAGTPDPADNSGVFKFVSIRFGGKVLGLNNEINGLTMGGVGSGTVIENIEVVNNTDDGFEWFGGTVNCKNLISAFNEDEDFDIDEGYQGKIQFAFALRNDELAGGTVQNGSELDGGNGTSKTLTPLTTAQIWNATYIGAGRVGDVSTFGNVFTMKDNFAGQFHNCVFDDFGGNLIQMDDTNTAARVTDGSLKIENSHWGRYNGAVATGQPTQATTLANGTGNTDPTQKINPLLGGISRAADGGLDPRPNTFSPLYGASLSTPPSGLETVNYRGAFGSTNWADGWTYLDSAGYFGDLAEVPPVDNTGEAPFADTDEDGVDDALEITPELDALGFVVGVDDTALFAEIFTSESIQDLSVDDLIVQKVGNNVTVTIPVESSVDLVPPFTPEGNATLVIPNAPVDKEFYRIRIAPDAE